MGDVIHLKKGFGFELEKKRYIYIFIFSALSSVYYAPVVLQKCDLWQSDRRAEQCLESSKANRKQNRNKKRQTLDSKRVSWEGTGIRGWTIKDQNNYMVKLEYLGQKFQAFTICFYTYSISMMKNPCTQNTHQTLKYNPFMICLFNANHNESSVPTFTVNLESIGKQY